VRAIRNEDETRSHGRSGVVMSNEVSMRNAIARLFSIRFGPISAKRAIRRAEFDVRVTRFHVASRGDAGRRHLRIPHLRTPRLGRLECNESDKHGAGSARCSSSTFALIR
jgi:hypothetical protein